MNASAVRNTAAAQIAAERQKRATDAVKAMSATHGALKLEELTSSGDSGYVHRALQIEFQPVWNVAKDFVTGYRWVARFHKHKTTANDKAFLNSTIELNFFKACVDVTAMLRVPAVLRELIENASPAIMVVPVHFETLNQARFMSAFIDALTRVPQPFRQFLVCEIVGFPANVSRFRLRELLAYLRGRCRSVFVRTGLEVSCFDDLKKQGVIAVGISRDEYNCPEAEFMRYMNGFVAHAEKAGLQTYAADASTRSVLMGAIGAGFSYIDGEAVMKPLDEPAKIHRFELENIYIRKAPSAQM
jgi:EAL domain-containing protein (putative c-di-GMP-specific phosphodiesterase class I)